MIRRLAIIPARGGSKRIKNKNIKNFVDNPMIYYPLKALSKSSLFNKIHVSTESEEIANVVEKLGYEIDFFRLKELADDYTPIMPVLKYVVSEYEKKGEQFDEVWLIMACNPLLNHNHLIKASKIFAENKKYDSLIAVSEYPAPIEWAFKIKDNVLEPVSPGKFLIRSQDLEKKYFDAGSFAIFNYKKIKLVDNGGSDSNHMGFILPKGSTVDIDDEEDWKLAEKLFKSK